MPQYSLGANDGYSCDYSTTKAVMPGTCFSAVSSLRTVTVVRTTKAGMTATCLMTA